MLYQSPVNNTPEGASTMMATPQILLGIENGRRLSGTLLFLGECNAARPSSEGTAPDCQTLKVPVCSRWTVFVMCSFRRLHQTNAATFWNQQSDAHVQRNRGEKVNYPSSPLAAAVTHVSPWRSCRDTFFLTSLYGVSCSYLKHCKNKFRLTTCWPMLW